MGARAFGWPAWVLGSWIAAILGCSSGLGGAIHDSGSSRHRAAERVQVELVRAEPAAEPLAAPLHPVGGLISPTPLRIRGGKERGPSTASAFEPDRPEGSKAGARLPPLPGGLHNPMPGGIFAGYRADTGLDIAGSP